MRAFLTKIVLITLVVAFFLPLVAAAQGGLRYTVGVTKFENKAGWRGSWDVGDAWGTVFTDILQQSGKFIVLGESDMRGAAMGEQDLAASGRTAQGNKTPKTGNLTPAQILVKGAITHVQHNVKGGGGGVGVGRIRLGGKGGKSEINVTIYMVDSTTGQVLASTSVVGTAKKRALSIGYSGNGWGGAIGGNKDDKLGKAVSDAFAQGAEWLIGQLGNVPWTGSVVLVKSGQVYVNRGTREGVGQGQVFVVGTREVLRDPDTGEILDESVTEIARLKAVTVKEKLTICDVISGNPAKVKKGHGVGLP
jgi:curli biogenesis system outer membrane secretion channel CsgG